MNPPRVLLVEDDGASRTALESSMRSQGYHVDAQPDGTAIPGGLATLRYDLVILDVRLPRGPNGFCLARMLRDAGEVPIILLSATDDVSDRLAGFDAGADDYLVKPFAMSELLARVRALLRRSGKLSAASWQVGDLVVDEAARTARREGTVIDLTRTEFDLLVDLGRHPDRVRSKTQLLASVWGFEAYDGNVVEVRISALRRKLERHGPRLIHTERGSGYRLRASG